MTSVDLDLLQERYAALLRKLPSRASAPAYQSRLRTRRTDNGDAHVEIVDGAFNYVVTERGSELHRRVAKDDDELLYWLLDDVTWGISHRSRVPFLSRLFRKDPRRHRFALHVELLERLDPAWAERRERHYAELLERYPFRDKA